MLDEEGIPKQPYICLDAPTQGRLKREKLLIFQAEQYDKAGFSRVSLDLSVLGIDMPAEPGDSEEMTAQFQKVRQLAGSVGRAAATLFGITEIPEYNPRSAATFERVEFIHTWYRQRGYLIGDDQNPKGHRDTPYTGATISLNLDPDAIGEWTIDGGKGRKKIVQTGNTVVMMSGVVNPYHLVEVPRKAPSREAVLLRLAGAPMQEFLARTLNELPE